MITHEATYIPDRDAFEFAKTGLRRFLNVGFVTEQITRNHNVPPKYQKFARRQAEQIRYCLIQAHEYMIAAKSVSLATKPLLLYYSAMSFALAEILFKLDGNHNLEKARGDNAHHGLVFRCDVAGTFHLSLEDAALRLRARPLSKQGGIRFGTFNLWHSISRECPIFGPGTNYLPNGTTEGFFQMVAGASDDAMPLMPDDGITLLHCFQNTPQMKSLLNHLRMDVSVARTRFHVSTRHQNRFEMQLIVQPDSPQKLSKLYEKLTFHPNTFEQISFTEFRSGISIKTSWGDDNPLGPARYPNGIQHDTQDVYFCTDNDALNEFGVLYCGLYILGNYARYFPDQWMKDVENSSQLALATEEFLRICEERLPIIILSELILSRVLIRK